jgi:hypothetical protein
VALAEDAMGAVALGGCYPVRARVWGCCSLQLVVMIDPTHPRLVTQSIRLLPDEGAAVVLASARNVWGMRYCMHYGL